MSQTEISRRVLEKVNILRDSLELSPLQSDHVLGQAGQDHAYYMSLNGKLNHFQTTFTKETPEDRVSYYGGNRTYVGENIAKTGAVYNHKGLKDSVIAAKLYESWLNFPPHYQNMINPLYTKMGLDVWVKDSSTVYAAQVFSSNEIQLPSIFDNNEISWGITTAEFTCKDRPVTYETMYFANSTVVDGRNIYLRFHDKKFFDNVIAEENDGMAIDIIVRQQLPCGKENQFHISKIYDGEMQRPVYKNDLNRNNMLKSSNKVFTKIGEVPAKYDGYQWEANIIIINDNKLCDYSFPVEVPSSIYPLLPIRPYVDTAGVVDSLFIDRFLHIKDSLQLSLSYNRADSNINAKHISYHDSLLFYEYSAYVKNIELEVNASVEGEKWINKKLIESRKIQAYKFLSMHVPHYVPISYLGQENWKLMHQQIESHNLSQYENIDDEVLRYRLRKDTSKLMDSLLFEQRKTILKGYLDTNIQINSATSFFLAKEFDTTLSVQDVNWNSILIDKYVIGLHNMPLQLLDSLSPNKALKANLFGAVVNKIPHLVTPIMGIDSALFEKLVKGTDVSRDVELFNYSLMLTQYWFNQFAYRDGLRGVANTTTPRTILNLVQKLDTTFIKQVDLERLKVNILLSGIHYYVEHNNWSKVDQYFQLISDLVKTKSFTPEEAMGLALFCNYFHKFKEAVSILVPFYKKNQLQEDALFVLAKTSTLIRETLEKEDYWNYMSAAKNANRIRYCQWLDKSFQIQRDEHIKVDFCKSCR